MQITKNNPLLGTDVYKMGHMEMYCPNTSKVYSYLITRKDKTFDTTVFFGLQYYLKEYLSTKLTPEMGEEFLKYRKMILGSNSEIVEKRIRTLCKLGYFPLEIKAVEEGTVMPVKNVLATITNTDVTLDGDNFHWVVGLLESLILKLWYPVTVASCCYKYRTLVDKAFEETVEDDMMFLKDFTVHDFGYRGDSSEEGAAISGAAHLLSFCGSDTVPALPFAEHYYKADTSSLVMASVPASEHSVMCSFGRDNEFGAFENILKLYPSGIVSIVSDTFDVYRVLTEFAKRLKPTILARDGKVVFRPDSGSPEEIICGASFLDITNDKEYSIGFLWEAYDNGIRYFKEGDKIYKIGFVSRGNVYEDRTKDMSKEPEVRGAIRLLDDMFGSTVNDKGYKVLNPKVGLIYGDGMYLERYQRTLDRLKEMGYAACNLVIGVGGILRNHSRDTLGFAIKATYVEVDGEKEKLKKTL